MINSAVGVLDASAVLAYLQKESGADAVTHELANGAVMSAVNYAEVLSRLSDVGQDTESIEQQFRKQWLVGGLLQIVPLTERDALAIAALRRPTRARGLSLGDRACLATAQRLGTFALTADRAWLLLNLSIPVRCIRP